MEYQTSQGVAFSFDGWVKSDSPLGHFDAGRWLECAHGVCFALSFIGDGHAASCALEDDGVLHELIHLALGIGISTHGTMADLRAEVAALQSWVGNVNE